MTPQQEAIGIINKMWFDGEEELVCTPFDIEEALMLAIEALEKQIPKKRIYLLDGYHCPNCDCYLRGKSFCLNCGQAIDWESDNE